MRRARGSIVVAIAAAIGIACVGGGCRARVDGPADDHAARDRAAGVELAAHVAALPGVVRASAIVRTPYRDPLAPVEPTPPGAPNAPRATASIAVAAVAGADAALLERDARRLAAAALAIDPADVTVAVEPPPAAPALAKLGPFEIAARDRTALAATLVIALALIAGLAGWIAALQLRRRAASR